MEMIIFRPSQLISSPKTKKIRPLAASGFFVFRDEKLIERAGKMIISMKLHAKREEIDEVRKQVEHFGYKVHSIEEEERVVIGVVGVGM